MIRALLALTGFALCVLGFLGVAAVWAEGGRMGDALPSAAAMAAGALLVTFTWISVRGGRR